MPNACKMRTHKKTIPTEFERFRNTNAKQMRRLSLRLKPRIPELFSDRNSGHVQVENQKTDLSPQRADYTGLHAQSLEGTCGPFVRVGPCPLD